MNSFGEIPLHILNMYLANSYLYMLFMSRILSRQMQIVYGYLFIGVNFTDIVYSSVI